MTSFAITGAASLLLSSVSGAEATKALVGDGKTDNTATLVAMMGTGGKTINIPAGDYLVGKFSIPDGTTLNLQAGTILRDSGKLGPNDRLITITSKNVRINGNGAKVVANRTDYQTGEQRHNIYIFGASHLTIDGLESNRSGGDGFYIGGPVGNPSTDITLDHVHADNNRRQGISITSAENLKVLDSTFAATYGTSPACGMDIEPNNAGDVLKNVYVRGLHTSGNTGCGLTLELVRLDATTEPISVEIDGFDSSGDEASLMVQGTGSVNGNVLIKNFTSSEARTNGIRLVDTFAGATKISLENVDISNSNASGQTTPALGSFIAVHKRNAHSPNKPFGGVTLRGVKIRALAERPRGTYGVWIEGGSQFGRPWKGLSVENLETRGIAERND